MRYSILLSILILGTSGLYAQDAIGVAGGTESVGSNQLSWTIGQLVIDSYSQPEITITHGLHQPELSVVVASAAIPNFTFNIYPNPTTSYLMLEPAHQAAYKVSIYNQLGMQLVNTDFSPSEKSILDLTNYSEGIYILEVRSTTSGQSQQFKILKK